MRIGIDAMVMNPSTGGIGRYIIEMVKSLSALPETNKHEFILYPGDKTLRINLPENWEYSGREIPSKGIVRAMIYPFIAKRDGLDLFYSATYLGPILPMPCRTVATVHDIIAVVYPPVSCFKHKVVERYLLPLSLKNASSIVAVSFATRNDVLRNFKISVDKIRVVYEGSSDFFYPRNDETDVMKQVRARYNIGKRPYLFYLGDSFPRKNLLSIVRAFSHIDVQERRECVLVMSGNIDVDSLLLRQFIKESALEHRLIFTGFVNEDDLPYLLSGARAFCFPSLYEGFGLPVLEAMACGCPVITSNVSSLPEVAGDAALLVDPYDVQQIADAMTKVLTDDRLCEDLRQRGLRQAKKFSWESAARQLLEIFNSI